MKIGCSQLITARITNLEGIRQVTDVTAMQGREIAHQTLTKHSIPIPCTQY